MGYRALPFTKSSTSTRETLQFFFFSFTACEFKKNNNVKTHNKKNSMELAGIIGVGIMLGCVGGVAACKLYAQLHRESKIVHVIRV